MKISHILTNIRWPIHPQYWSASP